MSDYHEAYTNSFCDRNTFIMSAVIIQLVNILTKSSENTLIILTFHFISLKLVSLGIIYRDNLPIERLSYFPAIGTGAVFDWLFYTAAGLILPLIGVLLINRIRQRLNATCNIRHI